MKQNKRKIANVITVWLVVIVLASCALSSTLNYFTFTKRSERQSKDLVRQSVENVSTDIDELADESILSYISQFIDSKYIYTANIEDPDTLSKELSEYYPEHGIEVNVVNTDGTVIVSSVPEYIGYDMHIDHQASELLVLLDGETEEYIQELRGNSYDESVQMKYAGKRFEDESGFLEIGLTMEAYYDAISSQARYSTTNRQIGEKGYLMICDESMNIMNSYHNTYTGKNISEAGITLDPDKTYSYMDTKCNVFGVPSFVNINKIKGIYVIGVYSVSEAVANVNAMMISSVLLELFVFAILFVVLSVLLRRLILDNMVKVNNSLAEITKGNLEERIEVRDTFEFDTLSTDINATVDKLKEYIAEAAARMDAELEVAKNIQSAALPSVFPPFPERSEFELFASMRAAKEVGGDFYDFYMLGSDNLAFLIADVSGKSIPGAMFMMKSKEVIKSHAESGLPPAGIFTVANVVLCEGNEAEMFLTAWMGALNLKTGEVNVANAGHNPPVLIRDGQAEFVILKPGLMLAVMDEMLYSQQIIKLMPGDILFLYTDGVTEAMDEDENQYGEERLLKLLSFGDNTPPPSGKNGIAGAICDMVLADIDRFVQGANQSDDITMMCIRYLGADAECAE